MLKNTLRLFTVSLVIAILFVSPFKQNFFANSDNHKLMRKFKNIYEASGVQSIADGRIIIIEDEKSHAIKHILALTSNDSFQEQVLQFDGQSSRVKIQLSDLEGITIDGGGNLFAITSFSRSKKGKHTKKRERFVRFRIEGNLIADFKTVDTLGAFIRHKLNVNEINIEAISFDAAHRKLLIGFREPIVNGKSLIVVLENPNEVFDLDEEPIFSDKIIQLDLSGGGIRALYFDEKLNGYFIANEIKNAKGKFRSRFWFWDGALSNTPQKIKISGWKNIKNIEGITSVNIDGKPQILIVSDDGHKGNKKPAHYMFLQYDQLSLEKR